MPQLALNRPDSHLQRALPAEGLLLRVDLRGEAALAPAATAAGGMLAPSRGVRIAPFEGGVRLWSALPLAGLGDGSRQPKGEAFELPLRFQLGDAIVEVVNAERVRRSRRREFEPLRREDGVRPDATIASAGPSAATLTRWFEALATLNRWSSDATEFYRSAAELVVEAIGLDGAYVVRRDPLSGDTGGDTARGAEGPGRWRVLAAHLPHPERGVWLDEALLEPLEASSDETWLHGANAPPHEAELGVTPRTEEPAYVVAPWCDAAGRLAGAVVGLRFHNNGNQHDANQRRGVRHLEANLVRLVAEAVTAANARREREVESTRRRVLLEQAFTPALARRIETDPAVLDGRRREVTLLFADLRGFSRLFLGGEAAPLSPVRSYALLREVMDALTEPVVERDGVVIDYYGDGLAAMWNAPVDQPDHAERAASAALAMVGALGVVSDRWADEIGWPLRLGVGIHSGPAVVGNIGSRFKAKYGARGESVNLASRVEQSTKSIGTEVVVTGATRERLTGVFATQRLCRAKLAGIDSAIDLFALADGSLGGGLGVSPEAYSEALTLYESGRLDAALRRLTMPDPPAEGTPAGFLAESIRRQRSERRGRRNGDRTATRAVIDFAVA